jgi:hypothetical protein
MRSPCADCPFRKPSVLRLRPERIREIARAVAPRDGQGGEFPCHKTTEVGGAPSDAETQCAGALIFAEKHDRPTQMMRIMERIGMYDRTALDSADLVWDDVQEWVRHGSC